MHEVGNAPGSTTPTLGMFTHNVETTEDDQQFYNLEQEFADALVDDDIDDDYLQVEEVAPLLQDVATRSAFDVPEPPTIAYDVPDDSPWVGVCTGRDRVIHLHPHLLRPSTLMHEFTHWLIGGDHRHGPRFAFVFAELVHLVWGERAVAILEDIYAEHGIGAVW